MWALLLLCGIFIVVGFVFSKKVSKATDFLVAGRGLPLIVLTLTIAASHFGSGSLVGGIQQGAEEGTWAGIYPILGHALSCFINAAVAPIFRAKANSLTPGDYIESRYGASKFLRGYHALVYGLNTMVLLGSQFVGFGNVAMAFDIDYVQAIVIGAVVIIIYTYASGMWGVAVTDSLQLMVCFVFLPVIAIVAVGNMTQAPDVTVAQVFNQPFFATESSASTFLYSLVPTLVGSMYSYEYFLRYQSAKSTKDARNSSILAGVFLMVMAVPIVSISAVAFQQYSDVPSNQVLSVIVHNSLPPWAAILFLATILAAIMSTADSFMASLGGIITRDIYHKLFHPKKKFDDLPHILPIIRVASICAALVGLFIALQARSIIKIAYWFSPFTTGVMFAPMIIGLIWKRASRVGAIASVSFGALAALLHMTGIIVLPERVLGTMAVGTLAMIIFSLIKPDKTAIKVAQEE